MVVTRQRGSDAGSPPTDELPLRLRKATSKRKRASRERLEPLPAKRAKSASPPVAQPAESGDGAEEDDSSGLGPEDYVPLSVEVKDRGTSPAEEEFRTKSAQTNSKHIRFESGEPLPATTMGAPDEADVTGESLSREVTASSDDDSPEAVTSAVAKERSRAAAADAARAVEAKREMKRARRRQNDARLKEQSRRSVQNQRQASAKRKEKNAREARDERNVDDSLPEHPALLGENGVATLRKSNLPDLLPEELLTDDLFQRPPTPPAVTETQPLKTASKIQRLDYEPEKPQDVQVGSVRVRVMEKFNPRLAPRSASKSKLMRESWLSGRRGRGGLSVARKSVARGFFRT